MKRKVLIFFLIGIFLLVNIKTLATENNILIKKNCMNNPPHYTSWNHSVSDLQVTYQWYALDPDNDDISFHWKGFANDIWHDTSLVPSPAFWFVSWKYLQSGLYHVQFYVSDEHGATSKTYSEFIFLTKNRTFSYNSQDFLQKILPNIQNMFPFLQNLLNRFGQ